jgi:hypothetical protein
MSTSRCRHRPPTSCDLRWPMRSRRRRERPAKRWSSAGAFVSALEAALAAPHVRSARQALVAPATLRRTWSSARTAASAKRWALIALAAAIGMAWWMMRAPSPPPIPSASIPQQQTTRAGRTSGARRSGFPAVRVAADAAASGVVCFYACAEGGSADIASTNTSQAGRNDRPARKSVTRRASHRATSDGGCTDAGPFSSGPSAAAPTSVPAPQPSVQPSAAPLARAPARDVVTPPKRYVRSMRCIRRWRRRPNWRAP